MNRDLGEKSADGATPTAADTLQATLRFLRVLVRRKRLLAASLGAACLLGALHYATAARLYEARASLLVQQTGLDPASMSLAAQAGSQALIPTYERLFTSRKVLEGAMLRLSDSYPELHIENLESGLSASGVRRTNVIELSYRWSSPKVAEAVVREVVDSYLEFIKKDQKDVSRELLDVLETELTDVKQRLATKRQQYLDATGRLGAIGVVGNGSQLNHPAVQRALHLSQTLGLIQEKRIELQTLHAAITAAAQNGGDMRQYLAAIEPAVGGELLMGQLGMKPSDLESLNMLERGIMDDSARLQTILHHLGPNHPEVVQLHQQVQNARNLIAGYHQRVQERMASFSNEQLAPMLISLVTERLRKAQEHERQLKTEYADAEQKAVKLNGVLAEWTMVERELERLQQEHETLLERIAGIDLTGKSGDVRVSVVSPALAKDHPVSPKLLMVGLLSLAGGLTVGVGAIYVLDVMDDRFRSPEEMREQLAAPILAMVRQLTTLEEVGLGAIQVHVSPESVESESFRTLRTTLTLGGVNRERLAITSTEPGDGKTTVIANLGVSYAQAGKRTLLIDTDLRRPGLTKLFGLRGQAGLSEILRSESGIAGLCAERILATGVDNLDILPCGPKPSNPTELLSGPRLEELLGWAEMVYDQILIDCPPVLVASDASIIGRLVEGMVLVVQPAKNHRKLVLRAVETLRTMDVELAGVVANRIGDENNDGYGYGYGYGYNYGYGEEETDDEFPETASVPVTPARRSSVRRAA